MTCLQTVILYSEAKKEDNVNIFARDLDALIIATRKSVQHLSNRVSATSQARDVTHT